MDVVKVAYPRYKYYCAPKLTVIHTHVVLPADMEYPRKTFVDIRGNIKHGFNGLLYEREVDNSKYN